jgi:hypothetical protein
MERAAARPPASEKSNASRQIEDLDDRNLINGTKWNAAPPRGRFDLGAPWLVLRAFDLAELKESLAEL